MKFLKKFVFTKSLIIQILISLSCFLVYSFFNYEIIDGGDIIKGISNEILSIKNKIIFTMSDLISNLNTSNEQFRVLINVIATKNTTKEIDKIICTFINN